MAVAAAAVLAFAPGCQDPAAEPPTDAGRVESAAPATPAAGSEANAPVRYALQVGQKTIAAELAVTPEDQRQGLMHRKSLPPDAGMLFVFERPKRQSFWMKNTLIPLDIGYFTADGRLREIYTMHPGDLTNTTSYRNDIQFALEMEAGWFAENDVRVTQNLHLDRLRAALEAAGHDPARFGL